MGLAICLVASLAHTQSRAGRGAKRGAAMGAVWGLIFGGDIESAVEGAAAGAAVGAVGGAVSDSYAKKDRKRYEQQRAQAYAEQQARVAEAEREKLEEERKQLEAEKKALEEQQKAQQAAGAQTASAGGDPVTEEEWIAYIGVDNWNALTALVDCQHQRALLLAQAAATIDDPEFRLASRWIEAFVAVDLKDQSTANDLFPVLVSLDPEVDTVQQASIEADKAIVEIRDIRRQEGIACER